MWFVVVSFMSTNCSNNYVNENFTDLSMLVTSALHGIRWVIYSTHRHKFSLHLNFQQTHTGTSPYQWDLLLWITSSAHYTGNTSSPPVVCDLFFSLPLYQKHYHKKNNQPFYQLQLVMPTHNFISPLTSDATDSLKTYLSSTIPISC